MEISLRRARRLEMALRGISVSGQTAMIRTYDTQIARDDLTKAVDALQSNIEEAIELNEIRYFIINQINTKNKECGISDLLNNKDLLHDEKAILENVMAPDDTEVQLNYLSKFTGKTISMVTVRKEHFNYIVDRLHSINRDLSDISDELYRLNNDTFIQLDEDDTELLKSKGLI